MYAKDSSDVITGGVNNATNVFLTGDVTHVAGDRDIVIERDDFQGPPNSASPARQKKLYLFDLNEVDAATGALKKRLLVDLLNIDDPNDIGGPLVGIPRDIFNFPLQSVESVTPVDDFTVLVGLDNNCPGGNGRVPGARRHRDHHAPFEGAATDAPRAALQGRQHGRAQQTRRRQELSVARRPRRFKSKMSLLIVDL